VKAVKAMEAEKLKEPESQEARELHRVPLWERKLVLHTREASSKNESTYDLQAETLGSFVNWSGRSERKS
jgi:hypothetical protein